MGVFVLLFLFIFFGAGVFFWCGCLFMFGLLDWFVCAVNEFWLGAVAD